ncbi:MAG: hypoxanthine phosphoribosyltransferase [Chloroflexi bacterium]|nr:hypoxanthine phosphoribosyltransferase [Chloroflexota bacterium]
MSTATMPPVLFSRAEVQAAVSRLAGEISRDYHDRCPVLVGVLKGSFMFLGDLVRQLDFPLEVDFIRVTSYGPRGVTSGRAKIVHGLCCPVRGKDVIVVEDIIDTGITTAFLLDYLAGKKPASLKLCVLMDKPARRQKPVRIDYLGLATPDRFLVGYGMDWNEKYRNLPDVCFIETGDRC